MNSWLSQYISDYSAIVHVIPILGVPILEGVAVDGSVKAGKEITRESA